MFSCPECENSRDCISLHHPEQASEICATSSSSSIKRNLLFGMEVMMLMDTGMYSWHELFGHKIRSNASAELHFHLQRIHQRQLHRNIPRLILVALPHCRHLRLQRRLRRTLLCRLQRFNLINHLFGDCEGSVHHQ